MIEVLNINPIQKGTLLATCDVHIKPWKLTLCEVKIFEKGTMRWIGLPAKEFVTDANEKKYIELVTFDNDAIKNRFKSQIMGAIDKFLEANPEMEQEDLITESVEIPF